ncbi:hypothetical protein KKE26_05485 [bacterium]|nr:hypothetical protein [bacterium]
MVHASVVLRHFPSEFRPQKDVGKDKTKRGVQGHYSMKVSVQGSLLSQVETGLRPVSTLP